MAIATDLDIRANRERSLDLVAGKPFIDLNGIAPNIGVGGFRHLEVAPAFQYRMTIFGRGTRVLERITLANRRWRTVSEIPYANDRCLS